MEKLFKDYVDPSLEKTTITSEKGGDLPLGENTLTNNLGVPIVVVVTKVKFIEVNAVLLPEA